MSSSRQLRPFGVFAACIAAFALLIAAPGASAVPVLCSNGTDNGDFSFLDSANNMWELDSTGMVSDGGHDAFDDFAYLSAGGGNQYDATNSGSFPYQCDLQAGGRQLAMPETDTPGVAGLKWSRKIYVSGTGTPFARWVDFLRNPTNAPIVLPTLRFGGNLGSDNTTAVLADSDQNDTVSDPNTDPWLVTWDQDTTPARDPAIAEIWDGTTPGAADAADHVYTADSGTTVFTPTNDQLWATYDNVTVPAGATIAYMHILAVDLSAAGIRATAPKLGSGNAGEAFRGLTATELAQIANWNTSDADADGSANAADNCMTDANANQADLDADGIGDVCDSDLDGDGVSNADEAVRGSDPAKADTDGDGKGDAADACPAKSGSGDDGCPRFDSLPVAPAPVTVTPPAPDKTAPVAKLTLAKKTKLKSFLKGVRVKVACSEACKVVAELSGSVKSVRISRAYNLLMARKSLASGTGSRSLTLKPSKKLVGKAKKFSVQLKVTATDAAGNVTVKKVTIKVA